MHALPEIHRHILSCAATLGEYESVCVTSQSFRCRERVVVSSRPGRAIALITTRPRLAHVARCASERRECAAEALGTGLVRLPRASSRNIFPSSEIAFSTGKGKRRQSGVNTTVFADLGLDRNGGMLRVASRL